MSTAFFALAIAAAIGADPALPTVNPAIPAAVNPVVPTVDPAMSDGAIGTSQYANDPNYPMTSSGVTGGIFGDPLFPFDSQYPWQHGYFQEISPYSGYHYFKPYNYRHVLSQTQTAAGWGITPQLAYSQHFWNRYQEQATWKNYALPPRESDIEAIQKRKKEYLERQQQQQSTTFQQQKPTMVPVQYQNVQPQAPYQPQLQQPVQLQFQQQPTQRFQQPAPQFQQPVQQFQQPAQNIQQPAPQFQQPQRVQQQYPAGSLRFNPSRGY